MSTHEVKVIRINKIEIHPNADRLEIVPVWGYNCVVRKGQFKVGDLAAYIESDYVVSLEHEEFSFLKKEGSSRNKMRITASKFRGMYSQGLLIKAPEGAVEGDNVMEKLGVTRWEPKEKLKLKGALAEKGPEVIAPKYDLENLRKYHNVLKPNEEVIITGKIHGSSAKYVYQNDRMWAGSRTQWKLPPGKLHPSFRDGTEPTPISAWWLALKQNPWIEDFCKENPGIVLYGEIFGPSVQGDKFHYGKKSDEIGFAAFDVLEKGQWLPNPSFKGERFSKVNFVETLFEGKYNIEVVEKLAKEKESFNKCGHLREGVVVKLQKERFDEKIGRVALKYVSDLYLMKS